MAEALGFFDKQKDQSIQPLIDTLNDDNAEVRAAAILSLGKLGKDSGAVEDALKKFDNDQDQSIRLNLGVARVFLGTKDESSIPLLAEAVASKNKTTAEVAVDLLGEIGPKAPEKAVPALVAVLEQGEEPGAGHALRALRRIGDRSAPALPQIAALYDKADAKQRVDVLRALVGIDIPGNTALPILIKALEDSDSKVRKEALLGIMRFRDKSDLFLEPLTKSLKDEAVENRQLALGMIKGLGPKASGALPAVIALTKDPNLNLRISAISSLSSFGPPTPEMIGSLEEAIHDQAVGVRSASVGTLRRIGPAQPTRVISILEKAKEVEKDQRLQRSITAALQSLTKKPGAPASEGAGEGRRKKAVNEKEEE